MLLLISFVYKNKKYLVLDILDNGAYFIFHLICHKLKLLLSEMESVKELFPIIALFSFSAASHFKHMA